MPSRSFSGESPNIPHLARGNEVGDLRADVERAFQSLEQDPFQVHLPIVGVGRSDHGPTAPSTGSAGPLLYLEMNGTDMVYRTVRISKNYVSDAALHVHWTKSQDTDQSGNNVKWRVEYSVFDGHDDEVTAGSTFIEFADATYLDAGTTTRVVYRTEDVALVGVVAGYYLAVKVFAVAPASSQIADPGLITVDLTYNGSLLPAS